MNGIWFVFITVAAGVLVWFFRNRARSAKAYFPQNSRAPLDRAAEQLSIAVREPDGGTDQKIQAQLRVSPANVPADTAQTEFQPLAAAAEALVAAGFETNLEAQPRERDRSERAPEVTTLAVLEVTPADAVELSEADSVDEEFANSIHLPEEALQIDLLLEETADEFSQPDVIAEHAFEYIQPHESAEIGGGAPAVPSEAAANVDESDVLRIPQRYRPPTQKPPSRLTDNENGKRESSRPVSSNLITEGIRIRLSLDRFGFCNFSLLPERTYATDEEVPVTLGGRQLRLLAQDVWYQDVELPDAGMQLREGLELNGRLTDRRRARWVLTGRDLYVLASHPRATGFISTNRLALGRSHVVLCVAEMLGAVETILHEAGCAGYTKLDQSYGVPTGWIALREVSPMIAIPLGSGTDPFYAIKPAPDIEIEFEGGLWLRNSVWLAGYPPRIKVLGESNVGARVLIDGIEAVHGQDGSLSAEGCDLVGQHTVYVEGLSCSASYSIEEPPASWELWAAHRYGQTAMCGPLVELQADRSGKVVTVPMSNLVLLGALPGEIFYCSRRSVPRWRGYVPFEPVWALPAYPLTSNKRTARVIQLAVRPVLSDGRHTKAAYSWSNAILDACRKGLPLDSESAESRASWSAYKKVARNIWRAGR